MLLQVARHVNPANKVSGPFFVAPVDTAVSGEVGDNSSYFKFNLDYMTFYNLLRLQGSSDNRGAYQTVRNYTAPQQNAFFDMVDRALNGPNDARDAGVRTLLDQWLQREKRDLIIDLSHTVPVCGAAACQPVPLPERPPADFIWQVSPFQLSGGLTGTIEYPGIDYILPYWMARFYGVIVPTAVSSSAASTGAVAPSSLASLYGTNVAPGNAHASEQPLPTTLGGVTVTVSDSAGIARQCPLVATTAGQINFVVPDGTAAGSAIFTVAGNGANQTFNGSVQPVAPTLFTMNGTGVGVAAATAVSVSSANPQAQTPVPVFQCGAGGCSPVNIAIPDGATIVVSLYGTGIRNRSSLANVSVTINRVNLPVAYAGPAPGFTGLDQVNVQLSPALRGIGEANVVLTVDGQTANVVTLAFQ